ncbi:MAG: hypothetical protein JSR34_07045 [Proteobacteria bacterium]|nr:hypothetical protein [Pseudomonadota bacterium]
MWRIAPFLLAIGGIAGAYPNCQPSDSTASDLRHATQIVQRLPELADWTGSDAVYDTGKRERVSGQCYEAVYVYHVMPSKDLDLRYVFLVHLPTERVLFEDIGTLQTFTLKQWRVRMARHLEP